MELTKNQKIMHIIFRILVMLCFVATFAIGVMAIIVIAEVEDSDMIYSMMYGSMNALIWTYYALLLLGAVSVVLSILCYKCSNVASTVVRTIFLLAAVGMNCVSIPVIRFIHSYVSGGMIALRGYAYSYADSDKFAVRVVMGAFFIIITGIIYFVLSVTSLVALSTNKAPNQNANYYNSGYYYQNSQYARPGMYNNMNGNMPNQRYNNMNGSMPNPAYNNMNGNMPNQRYNNMNGNMSNPGYNNMNGNMPNPGYNNMNGNMQNPGYNNMNGNMQNPGYNNMNGNMPNPGYNNMNGNMPNPGYNNMNGNMPNPGYNNVNENISNQLCKDNEVVPNDSQEEKNVQVQSNASTEENVMQENTVQDQTVENNNEHQDETDNTSGVVEQ